MLPLKLYANEYRVIGCLTEKYTQCVCNLEVEFTKLKKRLG